MQKNLGEIQARLDKVESLDEKDPDEGEGRKKLGDLRRKRSRIQGEMDVLRREIGQVKRQRQFSPDDPSRMEWVNPAASAFTVPAQFTFSSDSSPDLGEVGKRKINLHRDGVEAMDALTALLKEADASYVLGGEAPTGRKVSVHFNATPLEDALGAVAEAAGLAYHVRGNVIVFSPRFAAGYGAGINLTYSKVPVLGDIPIIGNLFRHEKRPGSPWDGTVPIATKRTRILLKDLTVGELRSRLKGKTVESTAESWSEYRVEGKDGKRADVRLEGEDEGRTLDITGTPEAVDEFVKRVQGMDRPEKPRAF